MTATVIVRPEAEQDALSAFRYYENERAGLGADFLAAVRAQIWRIAETPNLYPRKYRAMRRVQLDRFPYGIVYTYDRRARMVRVLAIMHAARDPRTWQRRA